MPDGLHPNVGRIHAAVDVEAGGLRAFAQDLRVAHVMLDQRADLLLALRSIKGLRAALRDSSRR